jgi:SAM-dependent methyltransferase
MLEDSVEKLKPLNYIGLNFYGEQLLEPKDINVYLAEADNEKLPFEDNQFDIVISNLSLQLVTHPEIMLKESLRVTKNDCYNAFSVWGRNESSLIFTLFDDALKAIGQYGDPKIRTNFHLGQNDEELIKLVLNTGYSKVNLCHSFIPFNFIEKDEYDCFYNTNLKIILANMSNEKVVEFKNEVNRIISDKLENNMLIGMDVLIILSKKE